MHYIEQGFIDYHAGKVYKVKFISPTCIMDKLEMEIDVFLWQSIRLVVKLWDFPKWIYRIYHKVKYGYNDHDIWCTPDYLASIIPPMIEHLKNRNPVDVSEKKWKEIIETIQYTFNTAHDILEDNKLYISTNTKNWEQLHQEMIDFSNRCKESWTYGGEENMWNPMSWEECKRYEQGWYYFQKYYFYLYD